MKWRFKNDNKKRKRNSEEDNVYMYKHALEYQLDILNISCTKRIKRKRNR